MSTSLGPQPGFSKLTGRPDEALSDNRPQRHRVS
jgi:hypothetical protein